MLEPRPVYTRTAHTIVSFYVVKGRSMRTHLFFKVIRLYWEGIEFLVEIINPRRMRGGYGSHRVCVCVSVCPRASCYMPRL